MSATVMLTAPIPTLFAPEPQSYYNHSPKQITNHPSVRYRSRSLEASLPSRISNPSESRCRKRKLCEVGTFASSKFQCHTPAALEAVGGDDIDMNLLKLSIGEAMPANMSEGNGGFDSAFRRFIHRQSCDKLISNAIQLSRLREQKHFVRAKECMGLIYALSDVRSENESGVINMQVSRNSLNAVLEIYSGNHKPKVEDIHAVGQNEDPCHPQKDIFNDVDTVETSRRKRSISCPTVLQERRDLLGETPNDRMMKNLQKMRQEINYVKLLRDPQLVQILLEERRQRAIQRASNITSKVPEKGRKRFQMVVLHGKRFPLRRFSDSDCSLENVLFKPVQLESNLCTRSGKENLSTIEE